MGFLELAELLKWPAIVAGSVLFAIWVISKIRRGIGSSAVAKDDLKEAEGSADLAAKARKAVREAPQTGDDLDDELQRRVRGEPSGPKP